MRGRGNKWMKGGVKDRMRMNYEEGTRGGTREG